MGFPSHYLLRTCPPRRPNLDTLLGMDSDFSETPELPYGKTIRSLGVSSLALMILGAISGLAMLLLKWATGSAPHILSIIPLMVLPVAFMALLAALFFTLLRRRTS